MAQSAGESPSAQCHHLVGASSGPFEFIRRPFEFIRRATGYMPHGPFSQGFGQVFTSIMFFGSDVQKKTMAHYVFVQVSLFGEVAI